MEKDEYKKRIANCPIEKDMFHIFQTFEPYVEGQLVNYDTIKVIKEAIQKENIQNVLSNIRKALKDSWLLLFYLNSFSAHVNQIDDIKYHDKEGVKKVKKLLVAYLNLSRAVTNYSSLFDISKSNTKSIILAAGLVKLEEDTIDANNEVFGLLDKARKYPGRIVIPLFGCKFDVLKNMLCKMKKNNICANILHFAGHGSSDYLEFADAPLKSKTMMNHSNIILDSPCELLFMNCCDSINYVNNTKPDICNNGLFFAGSLESEKAKEASEELYDKLFNGHSIVDACSPLISHRDYYLLPDRRGDGSSVSVIPI